MNKRSVILLILFNLFFANINNVGAQGAQNEYPMFLFLQNNFDSTIIFIPGSQWITPEDYFIIAKKGEQVYLFTYKSPYRKALGIKYPTPIREKFFREDSIYDFSVPDTNRFFLPKKPGKTPSGQSSIPAKR